jgi:hypothetical protein
MFFQFLDVVVFGSPSGYVSLQVGSNVCFYISTTKIWPYPTGLSGANDGTNRCNKIGLSLATVQTKNEQTALQNLASK